MYGDRHRMLLRLGELVDTPSEAIEIHWSENQVDGQVYRVPRIALERALTATVPY
jgi:hypothetical protein